MSGGCNIANSFQTEFADSWQEEEWVMAKEKDAPLSSANKLLVDEANGLYDRINKHWEIVEVDIQTTGVLKPVSMYVGVDEGSEQYLGVQKMNGKWRVCTGDLPLGVPEGTEVGKWVLVVDCPIIYRIELFRHIKELYGAILKSNEEVVNVLRSASSDAEDSLRMLGLK